MSYLAFCPIGHGNFFKKLLLHINLKKWPLCPMPSSRLNVSIINYGTIKDSSKPSLTPAGYVWRRRDSWGVSRVPMFALNQIGAGWQRRGVLAQGLDISGVTLGPQQIFSAMNFYFSWYICRCSSFWTESNAASSWTYSGLISWTSQLVIFSR